ARPHPGRTATKRAPAAGSRRQRLFSRPARRQEKVSLKAKAHREDAKSAKTREEEPFFQKRLRAPSRPSRLRGVQLLLSASPPFARSHADLGRCIPCAHMDWALARERLGAELIGARDQVA